MRNRSSGESRAESGLQFNIYSYPDRYNFSLRFANYGVTSGQRVEEQTYQNLCPNSERKNASRIVAISRRLGGGTVSIEGEIDPKNPDVITRTKTETKPAFKGRKETTTIPWTFRRKPVPLRVTPGRTRTRSG